MKPTGIKKMNDEKFKKCITQFESDLTDFENKIIKFQLKVSVRVSSGTMDQPLINRLDALNDRLQEILD